MDELKIETIIQFMENIDDESCELQFPDLFNEEQKKILFSLKTKWLSR